MCARTVLRVSMLCLFCLSAWKCDLAGFGGEDPQPVPADSSRDSTGNPAGPRINHAPTIGQGQYNVGMLEGESKTIVFKAKDEDGDPVRFSILNLDSLLARFPDGAKAIEVVTGGDSLVIGFLPGSASGIYRFRISVSDTAGGVEVQILAISVGDVNRPPSVSFAASAGPAFKVKEGTALNLRVIAEDKDGDGIVLQPLENPPWARCGKGGYDTKTGNLTFTPSFQCAVSGEAVFSDLVFQAKDDGKPAETGQISARITVQDSNSAPRWSIATAALQGVEGRMLVLDLAPLFDGDEEGDEVAFTSTWGSVDKQAMEWSIVTGFRDAGRREVVITASDAHKPPLSSKLTVSVTVADSVRVVDVAILAPAPGTVTADSVVTVKWTVGDREQDVETSERLAQEGPNVIRRSVRDSLGNHGADSVLVVLDTRPPAPPKVRVPPLVNTPSPVWTWTGGGGGDGSFRLGLDAPVSGGRGEGPFLETGDTAYAATGRLDEGRHVLYVRERDEAGNWSAADSAVVLVDLTAPDVKILSPLAGEVTNASVLAVTWTVDGVEQTAQAGENLAGEGELEILRESVDAAGNRGADSVTVVRKTVAAPAPSVSGPAGPTRDPEWSWRSGGAGGSGSYRIGWGPGAWFDTLEATRFPGPDDLADGAHTLYVSERDAAGNWSREGSFTVTRDRTPPDLAITGPGPRAAITSADPAITGEAADAGGLASVTYSASGLGESAALVEGGRWSVPALAYPAGDHRVGFIAADSAGNRSTAEIVIRKRPNTLFVRKGSAGTEDSESKESPGSGMSWQDAYGELYQAVKAGGEGVSIWVAEGEYATAADGREALNLPSGTEIYGGFPADGTGKSVGERRLEDARTVIRCDGPPESHALRMDGRESVVDGFAFAAAGGAIAAAGGNAIANCRIANTGGSSPVLVLRGEGEALRMRGCRVEGNRAADRGALVVEAEARADLSDAVLSENRGNGANTGAGLWVGPGAKVTLRGAVLAGNFQAGGSFGADLARQALVGENGSLEIEGSVEGGLDGIAVLPGGKVVLNGAEKSGGRDGGGGDGTEGGGTEGGTEDGEPGEGDGAEGGDPIEGGGESSAG